MVPSRTNDHQAPRELKEFYGSPLHKKPNHQETSQCQPPKCRFPLLKFSCPRNQRVALDLPRPVLQLPICSAFRQETLCYATPKRITRPTPKGRFLPTN